MDTEKIDIYLMTHAKYFPAERLFDLKEKLISVPDDRVLTLSALDLKEPSTIFIVSLFLGTIGVDRFMIGDTGMGLGKLFTLGGCGAWALIDLFLIMRRTKEKNFITLMSLL